MKNFIKSFAVAATLAITAAGGVAATSSTANAGGLDIDVYLGGGHGGWGHGGWGHGGWGGPRPHFRKCSPRKAVRKARRMGVRNAHIVRVNGRVIVVKGYKWGGRAKVKFAKRSRHCRVIAANF